MRFYQEITPTAFSVVGFVFLHISHSLLAQAYDKLGRKQDALAEEQQLKRATNSDPNPPYLVRLFQSEPLKDW